MVMKIFGGLFAVIALALAYYVSYHVCLMLHRNTYHTGGLRSGLETLLFF